MNASQGSSRSLDYMPRLDGLRAISVFGVVVQHLAPSEAIRSLGLGAAGVSTFFVLSGYLITRVLFQYRDRNSSFGRAAVHFYWRRLLRLSPAYYLAIAVGFAFGLQGMQNNWWVHGLYLSNLKIAQVGGWTGSADHFWSLATEEQFYLLWFPVILLLPMRWLVRAVVISMFVTLAYRTWCYANEVNLALAIVLLPGNLAVLLAGGFIAYLEKFDKRGILDLLHSRRSMFITGAVFAAVTASLLSESNGFVSYVLYPFAAAAFASTVVSAASRPGKDRLLDWLQLPFLRGIGKISYGIYIYHEFLPEVFARVPGLAWITTTPSWSGFLVYCVVSILVAQLSWVLLESRALKFKNRIPFPDRASPVIPRHVGSTG